MNSYTPTTIERLVNNGFYFVWKAFRGSWVLVGLACLMFGWTNVMYFSYGVGITATVLWEIRRFREKRMMNAAILRYFGAPEPRQLPE